MPTTWSTVWFVRRRLITIPSRDLVDGSHLQAVWLASTHTPLDASIAPMLDLDQPGKPLKPSYQDAFHAPGVRERALSSAQRVVDQLLKELNGSHWFSGDYVEQVIDRAPQQFSRALERWRVLFDATRQQMNMADQIVKSHTASHTERQSTRRATVMLRGSTRFCSSQVIARTPISTPTATWPAKAFCQAATTSRACLSWHGFQRVAVKPPMARMTKAAWSVALVSSRCPSLDLAA